MPPKVKRSGDRPLNFVIIGQAETGGKKKRINMHSLLNRIVYFVLYFFSNNFNKGNLKASGGNQTEDMPKRNANQK